MQFNRSIFVRAIVLTSLMASLTVLSSRLQADTGSCAGVIITLPFTDVMGNSFFCQIAGAYFSGLTNGTSATTFSPTQSVTREQMAAFTTRTLDQSLRRGSRRAALGQWWTTQSASAVRLTDVGDTPFNVKSDGADLWVANFNSNTVSRVRASDGKLLETWTGATSANGILVAMGQVFVTGRTQPGSLYVIDPTQPAGAVITVTTALPDFSEGIAFDGSRIWVANPGSNNSPASVAIVTLNPVTVVNITAGFINPFGILYDGANIWVTDFGDSSIKKLDSSGNILQSIPSGVFSYSPCFDGTNLWVPYANENSVKVIRAVGSLAGSVLATLSGNGLNNPRAAAFDGERILVTNAGGNSISLWKASDLTPLGTSSVGTSPQGACSDGINFWVALAGQSQLARF